MHKAMIRDGYIIVTDTSTGREQTIYDGGGNAPTSADVTDDDQLTVTYENGTSTRFRISTGNRWD